MIDRDWRNGLFIEKNLWQIYRRARRLGDTKFNRIVLWAVLVALIAFSVANEVLGRTLSSLSAVEVNIRSWVADGIGYTSVVLGFLVAGFTVFATVTKPELFVTLAKTEYKQTGLSGLKFIFFNFMLVFTHYVSFLSFCLFVKLFVIPTGPVTAILVKASANQPLIKPFLVYSGFVLTGTWFIKLLLLLKSFIWNVYQSVILSIVVTPDEVGASTFEKR